MGAVLDPNVLVSAAISSEFVDGLADAALTVGDASAPPGLSPDPDDDYLIMLARTGGAHLVSRDRHLVGSG